MASTQPLPIDAHLPAIVQALRLHSRLILQAPPGAGKTTRVPPALLDAGLAGAGRIVMIEPRRLAARAAARRIALERGGQMGEEVGYQVRFDRRVGPRTRIIAVTPGILLRWLHEDPYLSSTSLVVFDEFHERGVETDLALGMLKLVQESVRPELRIVLMSATLAPEPLLRYLGNCQVLDCPGRLHPVQMEYQPRQSTEGWPEAVARVAASLLEHTQGDVLAFLPGMREIRRAAQLLEDQVGDSIAIFPLHGDLPPEQQDAALGPCARRKVVLATNVAESSITVEGVSAVVDSGVARFLIFDPNLGLDRLELKPISRSSAEQRAGRAGRTGPGLCVRLWSEAWQRNLAEHIEPEIKRVDLAGPVLHLLALGEGDLDGFPWLDAPPPENVARALALLSRLGALGPNRTLTPLGRLLARFPAHPRIARLLIEGRRLGCSERAAFAAALLGERDIFTRQGGVALSRTSSGTSSDVLDRVEALERAGRPGERDEWNRGGAYFVLQGAKQLLRILDQEREDLGRSGPAPVDGNEALARCLLAAYPDRVVKRRGPGERRGVLLGGKGVVLAASSGVIDGELFLAIDLDAGAEEALVRLASGIQRDWLPADRLRWVTEALFDSEAEKVIARKRLLLEDLVLEENDAALPSKEIVQEVLLVAASTRLDKVLPPVDSGAGRYLTRLRCLAGWMPELNLPMFNPESLRELLPWVVAGCRSFADIQRGPWLPMLQGKLTTAQARALEREAPELLEAPSGRAIALYYEEGRPPVLAIRIQELFGLQDTPRIAAGKVRVLLHLLAPNYRPQQITDDLASFWKNTYPVVRKELRARYPKHAWPEDPREASALRKRRTP